jgi:hypothetical protein
MFVFAPVPLGSLAAAIDVKRVAGQCFPRLPSYLSRQSLLSVHLILITSHINFYVWFAQLTSTLLILCSRPFSLPHLKELALIQILGHVILGARAVLRKRAAEDLKSKGWSILDAGYRELAFDMFALTLPMASYTFRTLVLLKEGTASTEFRECGYLSQQSIDFALAATYFVTYAWLLNIILRFAWVVAAVRLYTDFKDCLMRRIWCQIPDVEQVRECAICLADTDTEACLMPCGHIFHVYCLESWARTRVDGSGLSCPMCRSRVNIESG